MRAFLTVLGGLVRPGRALDGVGAAVKWLWIPLAVILIASVAFKVGVATPMSSAATQAQAEAMFQKEMESWPEADRKQYEKDMAAAEARGELSQDDALAAAGGIASTAALVFGVLGAIVAIVYVATFFFVAAKTWANPVGYTTMLTVASLSLLPHAIRNVVQAVYMASTGVWLQHSGLGALVAPDDMSQAPSAAYAILSQIDVFVLWGLAILFGALVSTAVGIQRKRAGAAMLAFVVVTGLLQAIPTIVAGVFTGATGGGTETSV
jgi:hypothetical protein